MRSSASSPVREAFLVGENVSGMKALVWRGPNSMTVDEVPEPRARAGEAVIRSEAAGIGGSEIEGSLGRMSNRVPPLVMGHEFSGTVTEVGQGVDKAWLGKR